jgi:hypothetical protein
MRFVPSRYSYGTTVLPEPPMIAPKADDKKDDKGMGWLLALGVPAVLGIVVLPTFVVGPYIVKAFKPEWSYGRRLGASLGVSFAVGALARIARAASGTNAAKSK